MPNTFGALSGIDEFGRWNVSGFFHPSGSTLILPTITAESIDSTHVLVTFSNAMLVNAALLNPANYVIGGLSVYAAYQSGSDIVLHTSPQTQDATYPITAEIIQVLTGGPPFMSASFVGIGAAVSGQVFGVSQDNGLMHDLKLTADGDLDTSTGDLQIISGIPGVIQDIMTRLKMFQGEFFLDQTVGVPYFQEIFVKNPSANLIKAAFRDAILATPFVTAVGNLAITYDGAARTISIKFDATIGDTTVPINVSNTLGA
jgi:hypothetical protein